METTSPRDTIQNLLRKEKLRGQQRKRLRLMNEELVQRESLGIDLDLPFRMDHKETKSGEPQAAPTISPLTTEQTVIQV